MLAFSLLGLALTALLAVATPIENSASKSKPEGSKPHTKKPSPQTTNCFPSANFTTPTVPSGSAPSTSLADWWCPQSSEYAFMGFSYASDDCQSKSKLVTDFTRMRNQFGARYVRLYSSCEWNDNYFNDVIAAAYQTGIGVYALIWFGFDGDDSWKGRRDVLLNIIKKNKLAPYVVRAIAVGSEPLYDWAIDPAGLASAVRSIHTQMVPYGIQVSVSEMAYGYTVQSGGTQVLQAVDMVQGNVLPFFTQTATTGSAAWSDVMSDLNYLKNNSGATKKMMMTQTGWPSNADVWQPNSPNAKADLTNEKAYFDLLDSKCPDLKAFGPQGGVGWFAHIYEDDSLPGWGIVDGSATKIAFKPRTSC